MLLRQRGWNAKGAETLTWEVPFWRSFWHVLGNVFCTLFWKGLGIAKTEQKVAQRLQNGVQNGAKNALFGQVRDVSWIHYLLCLEHISPPGADPKRDSKSRRPSEGVPESTFDHLGWIFDSIWEAFWSCFRVFFGSDFEVDFRSFPLRVGGRCRRPGRTSWELKSERF